MKILRNLLITSMFVIAMFRVDLFAVSCATNGIQFACSWELGGNMWCEDADFNPVEVWATCEDFCDEEGGSDLADARCNDHWGAQSDTISCLCWI